MAVQGPPLPWRKDTPSAGCRAGLSGYSAGRRRGTNYVVM